MFGFLKKAISGFVDGIKKQVTKEPKPEEEKIEIKVEEPKQEIQIKPEVAPTKPEIKELVPEKISELNYPPINGRGSGKRVVHATAPLIQNLKELGFPAPGPKLPVKAELEEKKTIKAEIKTEKVDVSVEKKTVSEKKIKPRLKSELEKVVVKKKPVAERPKAVKKTGVIEAPKIEVIEIQKAEPEKPKGLVGAIWDRLKGKTAGAIETVIKTIEEKEIKESDVSKLLWDFQIQLIQSNLAAEVAEKICDDIKKNLVGKRVKRSEEIDDIIKNTLKASLKELLKQEQVEITKIVEKNKPFLVLFLGFNGAGKTTTLARVGHLLQQNGKKCVFAAGDSFRAASIEQLEVHGGRLGIRVIKQKYGADSAAVVFDAMKYAQAHGIDVVLADTAGRQHTNKNLMEELRKICRVNKPDYKILILDSLTGTDICAQSREFNDAVGVDAIIMTKVDVDEKGGAVISAAHTIKKPILYLGVGQEYGDLKPFNPDEYIDNLLS